MPEPLTNTELLRELQALGQKRAQSGVDSSRRPGSVWSTLYIWISLAVTGLLLWWAAVCSVEYGINATGQVVPEGSTQIIQSLDGGMVSQLPVQQGSRVRKGDILLRLDDTQVAARLHESRVQCEVLRARISRLDAEAHGRVAPVFPDDLKKERTDLVERELSLFQSRQLDQQSKYKHIQAQIQAARSKLNFLSPAINQGSVSELDRIEIQGEIFILTEQLDAQKTAFAREAMERLDEASARLEPLVQSIKADEDKFQRTTIVSPVDGTVNAIFAETVGRVIKGGEPIMEIVPDGEAFVVEAKVQPSDIGFIAPEMRAMVRFSAYDFATFGALEGRVLTVGADTISGPQGEKYYPARIHTNASSLGVNSSTGALLGLKPGMVAEVHIITGRRTILEYVLGPIEKARQRAIREH